LTKQVHRKSSPPKSRGEKGRKDAGVFQRLEKGTLSTAYSKKKGGWDISQGAGLGRWGKGRDCFFLIRKILGEWDGKEDFTAETREKKNMDSSPLRVRGHYLPKGERIDVLKD